MDDRMYLLRISLLEIEPEIWRQFTVPTDITLDRLHDVIQIVMGWKDYHLHEYTIGKKKYTEFAERKEDGAEDANYRLGDIIKRRGREFHYWYDFGDGWRHKIVLEDNDYFDHSLQAPVECIDGARACPPEDVGGMPGYYRFCEAVGDPSHEDHDELTQWYGGTPWYDDVFIPEYFSLEKVNFELVKYLRYLRERFKPWEVEL